MALSTHVVADFQQKLKVKQDELLDRKQRLTQEDPFGDPDRLHDNAAVDADAVEQFGHETISAMRQEVERKLEDISQALERIQTGSFGICGACGHDIEEGRLQVEPTASHCMACQLLKTGMDGQKA